jgi:secreted trypsin-like serine protease
MRARWICVVALALALVAPTTAAAAEVPPAAELPGGPIVVQIVGGSDVDTSTVPWMVALVWSNQFDGSSLRCGGTRLAPEWVLTAAHCVKGYSASSFDVVGGVSDLRTVAPANREHLSQIFVHPGYNPNDLTSDVALVRLAERNDTAPAIAVNADAATPVAGELLDTYGWGRLSTNGTSSPVLQGVTLQEMTDTEGKCGAFGRRYIAAHHVCAGVPGGGRDACYGDSGGPLIAGMPDAPVLVGVTSWGKECALADYPGMWSRVSTYASWIETTMTTPAPPTRRVSIGGASVHEGDQRTRTLVFPVVMTSPSDAPVTVRFTSADVTAKSPKDYAGRRSGTVLMRPGQTRASIEITVKSDVAVEGDEQFSVSLTEVRGAAAGTATAIGTIVDDDPAAAPARIDVGSTDLLLGAGPPTVPVALTVSKPVRSSFDVSYQVFVVAAGTDPVLVAQGTARIRANQVTTTLELLIPEAAVGGAYEVRVAAAPAITAVGSSGSVNVVSA